MLDIKRQFALADIKRIDKQVKRETSGLGRIEPKWAQNKRKISAIDTIQREEPPKFVGGYGPKATKHPTGKIELKTLKAKPKSTEGDIPFDAKLETEAHKNYRMIKEAKTLFPGWGKNPLAGLPSTMDEAKGRPPKTQKLSKPIPTFRPMVEGRKFNSLRPPLARTSLGGFQQMVEGWVR